MSGMTEAAPRTVSVVGAGRVTVPPDVAIVTLGVETTEHTLAAAQRENATRSAALRARLTEWGFPAHEVQTAGYNVWQDYNRDGKPHSYRVSNTVRLLTSDLARVGELLDTAIDAGANRVGGVTFGLRDEADALHRARETAMADARAKAEHYAALAGSRLGEVLSIAEAGGAAPTQHMRTMRGVTAGMPAATPIEAGEGAVTVMLQVVYALLSSTETGSQAARSS
jgi:uncharacterized protein YggE